MKNKEDINTINNNEHMTKEKAIDYLREIGWLQEHDRILTEGADMKEGDNQ